MNTRNQEAWDALRQERDDLLLAIDRCEETKTALHMNLRAMREDRDGLAAQVEAMRNALHKLACLGNGDAYGSSTGNRIAQDALALPNTADILRQRDARTLRETVERLISLERDTDSFHNSIRTAIIEVQDMADELERKPLRDMTEADFNEAHGG